MRISIDEDRKVHFELKALLNVTNHIKSRLKNLKNSKYMLPEPM